MLRVGLTGGIGSGKSTVAARLAEHGAVLIDADAIAREVVEPGTLGLAEIVDAFGSDVLHPDGSLNRPALAAKAFASTDARERLNAIVHPRIGARTAELLADTHDDAIVVHDVPLLVENGLAPSYHLVIVVDAPEDVRVRRLVEMRGMAEDDVRSRIAAQAGREQRWAVADVWLDNAGALDEIEAEVDALWAGRLVQFESNVRLHRKAASRPPKLHDPDPDWPVQAQRLIDRIRFVAGEQAVRVDQIGSTAVPGLPAKDVIDLQLTVSTMDDADALAGPLTESGFPLRPGIDHDLPKPAVPDVEQWTERYHCSADPGRPAHLHLRVDGSPGWRFALLLRDWLRADADAREEYTAVKRRLAGKFATDSDTVRYADAKEPWFDEAYGRAEAWAGRTGWTP